MLHTTVPIAGVAILIAVGALAQLAVGVWVGGPVNNGLPNWLPQLDSLANTVFVYSILTDILSYVIVPILVFVLGYIYGKNQ